MLINDSEHLEVNNDDYDEIHDKLPIVFRTIPLLENTLIALTVCLVALVLNATILRFYWNLKRSIAVYIRVFAYYDIAVVLSLAVGRLVICLAPQDKVINATVRSVSNFLAGFYILGPLFLALDRFIVVVAQLKFKDIERKVKIAKGWFLFLCFVVNAITAASILSSELETGLAFRVGFTLEGASFVTRLMSGIFAFNIIVQFISCLAMYAAIMVNIAKSEQVTVTGTSSSRFYM